MHLSKTDPELAQLLQHELIRERDGLELIPSENIVSPAVLEALGSVGTNKYSEGYPGKRYYGGQEFVDKIESLAIERAKKLFDVTHANVQPYSGSPANQAVCFALLEPGEKLMGMHLLYGGHLTHGWKVNFSSKYYTAVQYPTGKDGYLDYDEIGRIAREEKPKLIFIGATAYPRIFDFARFAEIAHDVDAYLVADISHVSGLIIGGVHPSPVGCADVITTTTHKTLRGPRGAMILCNGEESNFLKPPPEKSRRYLPTLIDRAVFPGLQGGPHDHQTAAIAVALHEAAQPEFKEYAAQIVRNAKSLADHLLSYGFTLISGGTDNHMLLVDVTAKGLTGKIAEKTLDEVGITVNKNTIPFDTRSPYDPSGIRIGTPSLTTRGMKESEVAIIADVINRVLHHPDDDALKRRCHQIIKDLCAQFPIYPDLSYL
ncbi:serine hydroxymethyltransferase [Candidatus Uhrbacteria bacterium]|nr:serine hydroxymethyltransferase [Candidatus Uhrbacteria bacterium]